HTATDCWLRGRAKTGALAFAGPEGGDSFTGTYRNAGGFAAGVFCGCLAYRARIKRNRGAVAAILRRRKVGRSRYDKQGLGGYPQASATSALIAGQRPTTYINAKMKTTDIAQTKIESERRRYGVLKSAKGLSKGSTGTLLPSAS